MVKLPAFKRGCHVITSRITDSVPELAEFDIGMANLFSESLPVMFQVMHPDTVGEGTATTQRVGPPP